jgi:hypothetical protein
MESVRLVPEKESLQIELYGESAALVKLSEEPKIKHPLAETEGGASNDGSGGNSRTNYINCCFI